MDRGLTVLYEPAYNTVISRGNPPRRYVRWNTDMACANVKVSELRTAYMPGRAKTGSADTSAIGITYYGKPIHRMEFGRYNYVAFYNDGGKFAAFQDNAGIDD